MPKARIKAGDHALGTRPMFGRMGVLGAQDLTDLKWHLLHKPIMAMEASTSKHFCMINELQKKLYGIGWYPQRSCTARVRATRSKLHSVPCASWRVIIPPDACACIEVIIPAHADYPAQLSTLVGLGQGAYNPTYRSGVEASAWPSNSSSTART